jgi:hypothetical protein
MGEWEEGTLNSSKLSGYGKRGIYGRRRINLRAHVNHPSSINFDEVKGEYGV